MTKEKLAREIADKVVEFYMSGMSYEEALKKAKEIYMGFYCKKYD